MTTESLYRLQLITRNPGYEGVSLRGADWDRGGFRLTEFGVILARVLIGRSTEEYKRWRDEREEIGQRKQQRRRMERAKHVGRL